MVARVGLPLAAACPPLDGSEKRPWVHESGGDSHVRRNCKRTTARSPKCGKDTDDTARKQVINIAHNALGFHGGRKASPSFVAGLDRRVVLSLEHCTTAGEGESLWQSPMRSLSVGLNWGLSLRNWGSKPGQRCLRLHGYVRSRTGRPREMERRPS